MKPIDFGEINYDNVDVQNVEMKDLFDLNPDELKYVASISPLAERKDDKSSGVAALISVAVAFVVFIGMILLAHLTAWGRYAVVGMILFIFLFVGVAILVSEFRHTPAKMKRKYSRPFTARVVMNLTSIHSHTHNGHTSHTKVYCPVFLTLYNNNYYVFRGHGYTNVLVRNPGTIVTLHADPLNREYIDYIDPELDKASGPVTVFIGTIFILMPLLLGFIFLHGGMS